MRIILRIPNDPVGVRIRDDDVTLDGKGVFTIDILSDQGHLHLDDERYVLSWKRLSVQQLQLRVAPAQIDFAMQNIRYSPQQIGQDSVEIVVSDNGYTGTGGEQTAKVDIQILVVAHQGPRLELDSLLQGVEDTPLPVTSLKLEHSEDKEVTVTIQTRDGNKVSIENLDDVQITQTDDSIVAIGLASKLQNALEKLVFHPAQDINVLNAGAQVLTVSATDSDGLSSTITAFVELTPVDDLPTIRYEHTELSANSCRYISQLYLWFR